MATILSTKEGAVILRRRLLFLLLCVARTAWGLDESITLNVSVSGAKPNTGQIVVMLFNSKKDYIDQPLAEQKVPVDESGNGDLHFSGLKAGEYAAAVYHDADMNGKLNKNFFGFPKEKIGFSNNAKPRMGPAPYKKARFMLSSENAEISITLSKAKRD